MEAISAGYNSVVKLTKNIHFNPNNPEYHNVYISNINNAYAMIHDQFDWKLVNRKEVINKIYKNKRDHVKAQLPSFQKEVSVIPNIDALERWLAIKDDDNPRVKKIKEGIELLLYNERNIPLASKK